MFRRTLVKTCPLLEWLRADGFTGVPQLADTQLQLVRIANLTEYGSFKPPLLTGSLNFTQHLKAKREAAAVPAFQHAAADLMSRRSGR